MTASAVSKVKDQPIKLPDGVVVKLGMTVYKVVKTGSSKYDRDVRNCGYIKKFSGESRAKVIPCEVIAINQASNARTFTVRTDRGCENTYSVRDNCIGANLFGSKKATLKEVKAIDKKDIADLRESLMNKEKYFKEEKAKLEATIKKLTSVHNSRKI